MATVAPPLPQAGASILAEDGSAGAPWVIAGVAAEIARRLRASANFIRVVLVIVSYVWPWVMVGIYAGAALLLPHGGRRRPGWRNLVGLSRVGIVVLAIRLTSGSLSLDTSGTAPAVWLTLGGAVLAGLVALFTSGRVAAQYDEARCRRVVIGWLPALVLATAIGVGLFAAPAVRWELVLELGVSALGVLLVLGWPAGDRPILPVVMLALPAILLASSGARLQGGVGDVHIRPASLTALHGSYSHAIGDTTLDLTALRGGIGRVTSITASVGIGNLTIVVPDNADGSVSVRVGLGGVEAANDPNLPFSELGFDVRRVVPVFALGYPRPPIASRLHLRIEADVGRGCVTITEPGSGSTGSCS